jgi:hypothetical protein
MEGRRHPGDPVAIDRCYAPLEREWRRGGYGAVQASPVDDIDGVHSGTSGAVGAIRD